MKYVRKGMVITVDRSLTDDANLFDRLVAGLRRKGLNFKAIRGRNRLMLPKLTLDFGLLGDAQKAEKWIDDEFEV